MNWEKRLRGRHEPVEPPVEIVIDEVRSVSVPEGLIRETYYGKYQHLPTDFWGATTVPSSAAFRADQFEALWRGLCGPSMRGVSVQHNPVWEPLCIFLADVREVLKDHGELTGVGFQHVGVTYDDDYRAVRHREILDRWEPQW